MVLPSDLSDSLFCPPSESICSESLKLFGRRRELNREQTLQVFSVLCVLNSRALFSWRNLERKCFFLWESTKTPQSYSHPSEGNPRNFNRKNLDFFLLVLEDVSLLSSSVLWDWNVFKNQRWHVQLLFAETLRMWPLKSIFTSYWNSTWCWIFTFFSIVTFKTRLIWFIQSQCRGNKESKNQYLEPIAAKSCCQNVE